MSESVEPTGPTSRDALTRREEVSLLASIFAISLCAMVYELLGGGLAAYFTGDVLTGYSLSIGIFLSSMGLGAYISRFVRAGLLRRFIAIEIALGVLGGYSALLFHVAFLYLDS